MALRRPKVTRWGAEDLTGAIIFTSAESLPLRVVRMERSEVRNLWMLYTRTVVGNDIGPELAISAVYVVDEEAA